MRSVALVIARVSLYGTIVRLVIVAQSEISRNLFIFIETSTHTATAAAALLLLHLSVVRASGAVGPPNAQQEVMNIH